LSNPSWNLHFSSRCSGHNILLKQNNVLVTIYQIIKSAISNRLFNKSDYLEN
jgi:hypothetical protein